jgi:penicillin-binding protein 2
MEKTSSRLKVLALFVVIMFVALTTRLWFLQVLAFEDNRDKAKDNGLRTAATNAIRGDILDARGRRLVGNRLSLEVRVTLTQLQAGGKKKERETVRRLAKLLRVPAAEIYAGLQDPQYYPYQPKPVAEFVDQSVSWAIAEHPRLYPGVEVVETSVRDYPYGSLGAQVLGWVGQIDAAQLQDPGYAKYGQIDLVGRAGLERSYERWLRGTKGKTTYLVNSDGDTLRKLDERAAVPGHDLTLAVDVRIQRAAEQELFDGMRESRGHFDEDTGRNLDANAGAVIVMRPDDGGVVALASWPTFRPSWFVPGLTDQQRSYLFQSDQAPTLNRATQLTYAPGSTFKPFVALSALKEGFADLGGYYPCPSEYTAATDPDGRPFGNWSRAEGGHISIARSLQISCDTVYYAWGDQFWQRWRDNFAGTNNEPFQRDLHQWGFDVPTGIDLPSEGGGLIPTPEWKEQYAAEHPELFLPDQRAWLPADSILLSIGSGSTLVTPIELARAYAAIANGGKLCRPHLVDGIVDADGTTVKKIGGHCTKALPYTQEQLAYIRSALAEVTTGDGTASSAFSGFPLSEVPVAGKTGTAPRGSKEFQDTSWFVALVGPTDHPDYVVAVMVEQGGFGAETAAPIARHVIERMYGLGSTGTAVPTKAD